mmetsp:Transcript_20277/g.56312  ORF Transcript_20277/g.56312 Transcript_20277/m.56312 type:complete len:225 (+) Transcript_20277:205-879(+)
MLWHASPPPSRSTAKHMFEDESRLAPRHMHAVFDIVEPTAPNMTSASASTAMSKMTDSKAKYHSFLPAGTCGPSLRSGHRPLGGQGVVAPTSARILSTSGQSRSVKANSCTASGAFDVMSCTSLFKKSRVMRHMPRRCFWKCSSTSPLKEAGVPVSDGRWPQHVFATRMWSVAFVIVIRARRSQSGVQPGLFVHFRYSSKALECTATVGPAPLLLRSRRAASLT